jgi:hypothetical protein
MVVGAFVLFRSRRARGRESFFSPSRALEPLRAERGSTDYALSRDLELQRLDREGDRVELRTLVAVEGGDVEDFLTRVRAAFPGFDVACVASDAVL